MEQLETAKTNLTFLESPASKTPVGAKKLAVAPTRTRKTIAGLGVSLAFLAYVDRACISQAAPDIMRDLHLTKLQMGYIFSAFGLTYAALELPSGWLCDRI